MAKQIKRDARQIPRRQIQDRFKILLFFLLNGNPCLNVKIRGKVINVTFKLQIYSGKQDFLPSLQESGSQTGNYMIVNDRCVNFAVERSKN